MKVKDIIGRRVKCVGTYDSYVEQPTVGELGTVHETQMYHNRVISGGTSVRITFDNGQRNYFRWKHLVLVDDHLENISKKYTI